MPLFTDGPVSSIDDLTAHDSAMLEVAGTESIDLSVKLALAQDEIAVELEGYLDRAYGSAMGSGLSRVVVTSPLKLWHIYLTLAMIYRDAYNNQLNDRYKGKWTVYKDLARRACERLWQSGVGIQHRPLPAPGPAVLEADPGAAPPGTYYVRMTWVGDGGESAPGPEQKIAIADGETLCVEPPEKCEYAKGWNVYVGTTEGVVAKQNATPLEPGVDWMLEGPLQDGVAPGTGQAPDECRRLPRTLLRG